MKEPFLPYLTLDQIYVSPIVPQEDGSYVCLSYEEMQQLPMPETGCKLMDAVARTMAIRPCRTSAEVALHLDVDSRKLGSAVSLFFPMKLDELVSAYRLRLICDLIQYTLLTPEEVAHRCGMTTADTLFHLLHHRLGTTFTQYRAQFQEVIEQKIVVYKQK